MARGILIEMAGHRSGQLLVLRRARPRRSRPGAWWLCICDCGALVEHHGADLRQQVVAACPACLGKRTTRCSVDPAARIFHVDRELRNRRHHAYRSKTLPSRVPHAELERLRADTETLLQGLPNITRPVIRGDCLRVPRPCPFVSCAHNLYLDVDQRSGGLKLNFPDLEPGELIESCALDVADRGGAVLEDVGALMNLTRERVRQIEVKALAKLQGDPVGMAIAAECGSGGEG